MIPRRVRECSGQLKTIAGTFPQVPEVQFPLVFFKSESQRPFDECHMWGGMVIQKHLDGTRSVQLAQGSFSFLLLTRH